MRYDSMSYGYLSSAQSSSAASVFSPNGASKCSATQQQSPFYHHE